MTSPNARSCGTCSACCRWPSVPEIQKPAQVPCHNLESCGHGCKIYRQRPLNCSKYRCSWVEGYGREGDQPDACGVLIDRRDTQFGVILVARDLELGVPAVVMKKAIKNISRDLGLPCLLVANDNPEKIVQVRGCKKAVEPFLKKHPELGALTT